MCGSVRTLYLWLRYQAKKRQRGEGERGGREVVGGSRQGASAIGLRQELECE